MTATREAPETSGAIDAVVYAIGDRLDGLPLAAMLDIDGTLSPIAPTPAEATIPAETRKTVSALIQLRGVTVALVTGRTVQDARRMAAIRDAWIIGNHGYELGAPDGTVTVHEGARQYEKVVAEAANTLSQLQARGAFVELKRWTLSFHYRTADPGLAPALVGAAIDTATRLGLRAIQGRKVVDIRPPLDVNKGTATIEFASRGALDPGGSVMYAGDDSTDEDAFRALRALGPRPVTLRVAAADEAPRETAAELTLGSTDAMRELLQWLAARRARA